MAASRNDYVITHHLKERFVQRTRKKYVHMQRCREEGCPHCRSLKVAIRAEIATDAENVFEKEIYDKLNHSDEDRSYLNNSGFMQWYYTKYGYDKRFEFLTCDDLLFVVVHDKGDKVCVTCVAAKTHLAGKSLLCKQKFNKVKKKEEKLLEI
jgi:hypothetical protein